jgi:putative tricarboxylic transport membrane protein
MTEVPDVPMQSTPPTETPVGDPRGAGTAIRNRLVGAIGLAIGVAVILHGTDVGVGEWQAPGPGMWPVVVGLLLCVVSVAAALQRAETLAEQRFRVESFKVLPGVTSLYIFVWAFSVAGLILPAFLLLVLWLRVLGRIQWLTTLVVAAVTTLALQYLFVSVLGVPFPDDLLL